MIPLGPRRAGGPSGDGKKGVRRGPGARAGRRDYPGLPRGRGHCAFPRRRAPLPGVRGAVQRAGSDSRDRGGPRTGGSGSRCWAHLVVSARATGRAGARGPLTVMAPGPPRAIGKGLFSSGFIAMPLDEAVRGRSDKSLSRW